MDIRLAAYAVITDDEGRLLLARWISGDRPRWTMPGGGLEPGEDPADAARREVEEETGYRIELDGLVGVDSHVVPGDRRLSPEQAGIPMHGIRIIYRARVVGGELRDELDGSTDTAQWFTAAEVDQLDRVDLVDVARRYAGLGCGT